MSEHALVSFVQHARPWEPEDELIRRVDLPLTLEGNVHNAFHPELTRVRNLAVAGANALPVLPNPGRRPRIAQQSRSDSDESEHSRALMPGYFPPHG
jgi:hypothetical protein